jgi:hypothetical protein
MSKKRKPRERERTALEVLVNLYTDPPARSKRAEIAFTEQEFLAKTAIERLAAAGFLIVEAKEYLKSGGAADASIFVF